MNKLNNLKYYKKEYVKAFYGRYGKVSGLNPGVLWPRKEELKYLKEYESAFCPKLDDLIAENKEKKDIEAQRLADKKKDILEGLRKLPGELKAFFDELEEKRIEKERWTKEREAAIEEARESQVQSQVSKPLKKR